jgi:hypothetical protein
LAYRLDVGRLEREEDAQPAEDDLVAQVGSQEGQLELGELRKGSDASVRAAGGPAASWRETKKDKGKNVCGTHLV